MPIKKAVKKVAPKKVSKKPVVKRTAKKTPAKKKTVKKSATKKTTKKSLVYADSDKSFWCTDGQILNSLVSLRDALEKMEKEVYGYHVDVTHNDFANWVEAVLADSACATALKKAKTPKSAKTVVVKSLKLYAI